MFETNKKNYYRYLRAFEKTGKTHAMKMAPLSFEAWQEKSLETWRAFEKQGYVPTIDKVQTDLIVQARQIKSGVRERQLINAYIDKFNKLKAKANLTEAERDFLRDAPRPDYDKFRQNPEVYLRFLRSTFEDDEAYDAYIIDYSPK